MKSILLAVLSTSLTAGILSCLASGSRAEKYLRYISALLLILAILSPLSSLLEKGFYIAELFPDKEDAPAQEVPEAFLRRFEAEIEKAVSALLESRFSLASDDCRPIATAEDKDGEPFLLRLEVRLYTLRGVFLTGKIRECLEEACGCEIVIKEEMGA